MRADEVRKGDQLWGRTVTASYSAGIVWCLILDGVWCYVPRDAELVVVRPPKMLMVELPEETVQYWACELPGDRAVMAENVARGCRQALADREGSAVDGDHVT